MDEDVLYVLPSSFALHSEEPVLPMYVPLTVHYLASSKSFDALGSGKSFGLPHWEQGVRLMLSWKPHCVARS